MDAELIERHDPIFNIKAVVHQTGLNPATIRAWERRYGLPTPQRTEGGHRQYSQHDIDTLKWLTARQDEGISISHAVELWLSAVTRGENPLSEIEAGQSSLPVSFDQPVSGKQMDELREAWIDACLSFDRKAAEIVLARAFALFPPEIVCFELLQKALVTVGDGWHKGEITIQQEHFTSALSIQRVETLISAAPPSTKEDKIIIANAPNDFHTFSALLLTYLIRRGGWEVVYLGADVPKEALEPTVKQIRPDLVILSAHLLSTAASMAKVARSLVQQNIKVAYGGGVFDYSPTLKEIIPGYFLGFDLKRVPQEVDRIIREKTDMPPGILPSPSYEEALADFLKARPYIEGEVLNSFEVPGRSRSYLMAINNHFSHDIIAGLSLGDLDLILPYFDWVLQMLQYHEQPQELQHYLQAFHNAASHHLSHGNPLVRWLSKLAAEPR